MNLGPAELLIILFVLAIPALVIVLVVAFLARRRSRDEPGTSVADEVAKLVALRDAGELTDDEFAAQKAKVLGQH